MSDGCRTAPSGLLSLPAMLDCYVAAIVAWPVSISPLDWICPLLAIDADAFNYGGTAESAAISAIARQSGWDAASFLIAARHPAVH